MEFVKKIAKYLNRCFGKDNFSAADYMRKQREDRLKRGIEDLQSGLAGMLVPSTPGDPVTTIYSARSLEDPGKTNNYEKRKTG